MKKHNIEMLISEDDVKARIRELAEMFSSKYKEEGAVLVGILNGSIFFLSALAQSMTIPVEIDFMAATSYEGTDSTGKVLVTKDLARSIEGRHVIVVEDIVDTGRTLSLLCDLMRAKNPASLEVVTLLDKPSRRTVGFKADYTGFEIPDRFVVGWGMDYNQLYRNLPYIGALDEKDL
ncbi:MAG: hypoxanthine phosphoribosyltransferase [Parasporobacterium sp.]|nr:hypoxanthine phosphoribosyltransferase [Parasporobacterium sp.]